MAKLNKGTSAGKTLENHKDATTNFEGGLAFKQDARTELYSRVVTTLMGEPTFYKPTDGRGSVTAQNHNDEIFKLIDTVAKVDPEFILQLAAHARNDMNLRTIPQVLLVEASLNPLTKKYVEAYTSDIVQRADEPGEAIAYLVSKLGQLGNSGGKGAILPHSLQKGLQSAIHKFTHFKGEVNPYQLAKYNRDNASVKMKDVINLVHPKPKSPAESELFKKVLDGKLESADTWEVTLSTWKEKGFESKKAAWEAIIPKMPIMATVRNLRNFLQEGVGDDAMKQVYSKLTDADTIRNSKMLPFRFFSAYREIQKAGVAGKWAPKLMDALQIAMDISVDNLPRLPGTWFITADVSGSMDSKLADRSSVSYWDISTLMLCIAHKMCEHSITTVFDNDNRVAKLSSRDGILTNMERVENLGRGGSTNAYTTADYLYQSGEKVDGFMLLSDMQCYDGMGWGRSFAESYQKYTRKYNPNCYLFSVNLAQYGTIQVPQDMPRVALISGWSEKILNFIPKFMEDRTQAVDTIRQVKPGQFSYNRHKKQEEVEDGGAEQQEG